MWIVDTALKSRADQNKPIRVGIIGAGFMCQGLTNQITQSTPGMRVAAISNRRIGRAVDVFHYSGFEDVAIAGSQSGAQPCGRGIEAGRDRRCDAYRAQRRHRRAGGRHWFRGVRRPRSAGSIQARQGRRADECRARRDDRADFANIRRQARSDFDCLRGRRAGYPVEPLPLGQGIRPHAPLARQRQGPAGSLSQPDNTKRVRRAMGAESDDGDKLRRWLEGQLRTGCCCQCYGIQGEITWHVSRPRIPWRRAEDRRDLRSRGTAQAGRRDRLCGWDAADEGLLPGRTSGRQAKALSRIVQDGRRGRFIRSLSRIISAIWKFPPLLPVVPVPRPGIAGLWRARWWRSVPSPSGISRRERCSTTTACT